MGGVQTYRGIKHTRGIQTYQGHPNIQAAIKTYGCIQTYGGIQAYKGHPNIQGASKCMGAYGHPLSLTKYAFFVLYMYSRYPNIIQTYMGASKHMGDIQHTGGIQTYGGHPNIQGASKYMGAVQTYGGIQTYAGHSNIWGCPNIQGAFLHAFLSHKAGFGTSLSESQYHQLMVQWQLGSVAHPLPS